MLDDLCKSPVAISIGGKTYEVSPLTQGDLGALIRCIQFEPYNTLKQIPNIPQDVLDRTLAECIKDRIALSSPRFAEAAETEVGRTETTYLALRSRHPEITREEIRNWNPNDCNIINTISASLSMLITFPEETKKKILAIREKFPTMFPTVSG